MDWEKFAWLKRGSRRIKVLTEISNSKLPLTIKEIKVKSKVALPQVSSTVKELLSKELIECLNPRDNIGKLYRINKEGISLMQNLK